METAQFAATLSARLAGYGTRPFIEFGHRWYTGDEVTSAADRISALLNEGGLAPGDPVGVVVRNRLPHAAAILGFVAARRPVVMIYSYQSARSIARDIADLALPAVVLDRDDWTPPVAEAVERVGCAAVVVSTEGAELVAGSTGSASAVAAEAGLHILTSGTTGPPKRVPVRTQVLAHTVLSMTIGGLSGADDPPDIVFWPFGSIGVCQLLGAAFAGKRMVLLEKFTVDEWVRAVRTYRVRRSGVQPAIVRMLLDADIAADDLSSLEYLVGGSGPLEPQLREAFSAKYGIPLLWAYGATEFAGSVCSWTPELYRTHGSLKPDSVGRPLPGVEVRIVDPDTSLVSPAGEQGLLEARVAVIGPKWIRTTDIASVDADGFVYIHGRADGAINRGGFKVLPETVRRVLLSHPAVRDACVVGVPDRRLGAVPFAAYEVLAGKPVPADGELRDWVRERLPSYQVPVAFLAVDELPRNASMKVRPADVAALYRAD